METCVVSSKCRAVIRFHMLRRLATRSRRMRTPSHFWVKNWGNFPFSPKIGGRNDESKQEILKLHYTIQYSQLLVKYLPHSPFAGSEIQGLKIFLTINVTEVKKHKSSGSTYVASPSEIGWLASKVSRYLSILCLCTYVPSELISGNRGGI